MWERGLCGLLVHPIISSSDPSHYCPSKLDYDILILAFQKLQNTEDAKLHSGMDSEDKNLV